MVADVPLIIADRAAVRDIQRTVAIMADVEPVAVRPRRAGPIHRDLPGRTGLIANVALRIADRTAIVDIQRPVSVMTDVEVSTVGPR